MDIAYLIYTRSWRGFPIRYWPEGVPNHWSHVGVHLPDKAEVWEARMGHRFGPTHFKAFLDRYSEFKVVRFGVPDLGKGLQWLEENHGKPYGTLTIVSRIIGLKHGQNSADHCSEAAETFLEACGLKRWRGDLHRVSPNQSFHNLHGVIQ